MRIDKWLWVARFFKTRSLAQDQLDAHRINVNGQVAKPGREIRVGDVVSIRHLQHVRSFDVAALSNIRGPAAVAQGLYLETPDSAAAHAIWLAGHARNTDPAAALAGTRPTKRDRRDLARVADASDPSWDDRWRAQVP